MFILKHHNDLYKAPLTFQKLKQDIILHVIGFVPGKCCIMVQPFRLLSP